MSRRQFTKGIDLVRAQQKRFEERALSRARGLADIAQAAKQDAIELTSGGLSPKQTRGAFARGVAPDGSTPRGLRRSLSGRQIKNRGLEEKLIRGQVPLLPINVQSGDLQQSVRLRKVWRFGSVAWDLVMADVPYAKYVLKGTVKMVNRGLRAEIKRRQRARMKAFEEFYVRGRRG